MAIVHAPSELHGVDKPILEMSTKLSESLLWLDNAFGKCQKLQRHDRYKRVQTYPAFHTSGGEYVDLFPTDSLGNFCFFIVGDPIELIGSHIPNSIAMKIKLSLVFWLDLDSIHSDSPDRLIDKTIEEVLNMLLNLRVPEMSWKLSTVSQTNENIYREFNISQIDDQHLMQPYGGLRFDGIATYRKKLC